MPPIKTTRIAAPIIANSDRLKQLQTIPGVGKSIAQDLLNIGIGSVEELAGRDPEQLFQLSNQFAGLVQDRCLLYVFRCAVYFAETPKPQQDPELLKWWNWKNCSAVKPY
jgi:Pathogenicity locus